MQDLMRGLLRRYAGLDEGVVEEDLLKSCGT